MATEVGPVVSLVKRDVLSYGLCSHPTALCFFGGTAAVLTGDDTTGPCRFATLLVRLPTTKGHAEPGGFAGGMVGHGAPGDEASVWGQLPSISRRPL